MSGNSYTIDTLKGGEIRIFQPKKGYRFSIDAVLLAHFVRPERANAILELGAGSGVVSFLLAHNYPRLKITAIEYQSELAHLAELGVEANALSDRMKVIAGDIRKIKAIIPRASFPLVCSNPPFREMGGGRISSDKSRRLARHEITLNLKELLSIINYSLKPLGRAFLVYPVRRMAELLALLPEYDLTAKRLRLVYPFTEKPANLFLLEVRRGGKIELLVEPPLYIWKREGEYSREVSAML